MSGEENDCGKCKKLRVNNHNIEEDYFDISYSFYCEAEGKHSPLWNTGKKGLSFEEVIREAFCPHFIHYRVD